MEELKCGNNLLEFVKKANLSLFKHQIDLTPYAYADEVDENEKFRKKYIFSILPIRTCIKDYLFTNRDKLSGARCAFKSSIRAYVTFMKFAKDVFNVKTLNLTRFVRDLILILFSRGHLAYTRKA